MHFVSSPSCRIVLARTSSTILNKRGESRHHCPDNLDILRGKASVLHHELLYSYRYSECFLLSRGNFPLFLDFWVIIMVDCWILSSAFSKSIDMIIWMFFFCLLIRKITLIDFWMSNFFKANLESLKSTLLGHGILFFLYIA